MWHWHKDRELIEKRETIDSSKIYLPLYEQLICSKSTRATQKEYFSTNGIETIGWYMPKNEL